MPKGKVRKVSKKRVSTKGRKRVTSKRSKRVTNKRRKKVPSKRGKRVTSKRGKRVTSKRRKVMKGGQATKKIIAREKEKYYKSKRIKNPKSNKKNPQATAPVEALVAPSVPAPPVV